jgi:hypothetical protein
MKDDDDQDELFDLPESKRRRDEGMERVSSNNESWLEACCRETEKYTLTRAYFTGEDIRFHCSSVVGHPGHHNAWGALTNVLLKREIILKTGHHKPMKAKRSHARMTPIYTRKGV